MSGADIVFVNDTYMPGTMAGAIVLGLEAGKGGMGGGNLLLGAGGNLVGAMQGRLFLAGAAAGGTAGSSQNALVVAGGAIGLGATGQFTGALILGGGSTGGAGGTMNASITLFSPVGNGLVVTPTVGGGGGNIVMFGGGVGLIPPGVMGGSLLLNIRAAFGSLGGGSMEGALQLGGIGLGVWPVVNYISVAQFPGYLITDSGITSQLLQANALASATQQSAVGVFLLASAIASDSNLSTQTLQTFVSASAQVYASINQAWYGSLNVVAIAAAPIAYQYTALAAAYANAIATGKPVSTANMSVAITTTMLALALTDAQNAALLNVNATAATSATQLYSAMTTIIANAIASTVAAPQMVFMLAASANALAAVSALPTAKQFATLLASADAYVRVSFNSDDFEGWVLNTTPRGEEGIRAFSNYQNFPYTSFATSPTSGLSYATSATGIYLLAGNTDSGTEIPAWIRSGLVDFGSRRDKRMESLYVGYTSDDRLVAKMITTNEGQKVETWYTMRETQLAGATREGRIEIGKGLHSVYWGFELHNNAGADFALDVVALWPVILDRRIS